MKIILYLVLLAVLAACGSAPIQKEGIETLKPTHIPRSGKKTQEWKFFFEAEQAFSARDYPRAVALYRMAKSKSPRGRVHLIASYRLGTIFYTRNQYRKAVAEFEYILSKFGNSELRFDTQYNLAAAEFQLGNYSRASEVLSQLRQQEIMAQGPTRAAMVYRLTGLAATGIGNYASAIVAYAAQTQLPLSSARRAEAQNKVDRLLSRIQSRTELEKLLGSVSEPITRAKIAERLEEMPTEEDLSVSMVPSSPSYRQRSNEFFETGSAGTQAQPKNIGVVLPLSGRWAPFGKKALNAILLAVKNFKSDRGVDFRVYIQDTKSSPINAANAVDTLVFRKKVFAIIGPINWKESIAVARRAQKLGTVNMLLTLKEGLSARGTHLFQNGLTARVQLENLIRYCFEEKGYRRFGILAPSDSFGRDMVSQFFRLMERNGGKLVASESYPPNETDFQSYIRSMVGLDRPQLRKLEWSALQKYIENEKAQGRRRYRNTLPPIIDFDAIFIPDSPKAMGQIAPSLTYLDVTNIPILGTAEWHSPQLYRRGGKHVEGAVFPGGIHRNSSNPKQRKFFTQYEQLYRRAPDLLAAQAYEAMELVGEAILKTRSYERNDLANTLQNVSNFTTVIGKVTFDDSRLAQRTLPIFELTRGGKVIEN